jgi:hypothetical protein|tara:strand:- start:515 stop:763 length:249 start_codon:yes stop_codon:yes gene_type:complete
MLKQITVEFHQAEVKLTRVNSVTGKSETFSTYPTIGFRKVNADTKPDGMDWFKQVASDWNTSEWSVERVQVQADWGIQSATR